MMELSNLGKNMGGSLIREMYNEALKLGNTISFTVGEPDFVTPQKIIDAACAGWQRGLTHYTPNSGIPELREAIAAYHINDLKPDSESQIIVTCGATEALQLALFAVVNPGDEVIVITPAWPNYFGQVEMCGAVVRTVPATEENGFIPRVEDVKNAITTKTRAIMLNSPSNPTGAVIDRKTCEELADLLRQHDIYIIADEVYSRLVYDSEDFTSITSFEGIMDKTIYINGFSKMFAMTGWRLGYAISRPEIVKCMTKLHENGASNLPEPSQMAAAEGLRSCMDEVDRMRDIYEKRRNLALKLMEVIPGVSCRKPGGAFYLFANIKETGMSSRDFCMKLLREKRVVVVPGSGFGHAGEGYFRLTYAASEDTIREGLGRIRDFVQGL